MHLLSIDHWYDLRSATTELGKTNTKVLKPASI